MKTKEEIISKYMHKYKGIYVVSETMALVAMKEYAEQQVKLCNKPAVINNEVALIDLIRYCQKLPKMIFRELAASEVLDRYKSINDL